LDGKFLGAAVVAAIRAHVHRDRGRSAEHHWRPADDLQHR
jgi:hypothetical protein